MHYKNGREAKVGDRVIWLTQVPVVGILHSLSGNSDTCNGRLAATAPNDAYVTIKECLHADDVAHAAAEIADRSKWPAP